MTSERSGTGQYDLEYMNCPCFWGKEPAKYVRLFGEKYLKGDRLRALDVGAGEGKNSLYLASRGLEVVAVEVSKYACRNFLGRMIEENTGESVTLVNADANSMHSYLGGSFDVVVSYGFLHCLGSVAVAKNAVLKSQEYTKLGGYHVVSAFTDRLPIPAAQDYLSPALLDFGDVLKWYDGWNIVEMEEDTITESHPTSNIEHSHSLFRMIARKQK